MRSEPSSIRFTESSDNLQYLTELSDETLLKLMKSASTEAQVKDLFQAIYTRHSKAIWNFIRLRVQNLEDAEDIFSELWGQVFLKALPTLEIKHSLRGWLVGVAMKKIASLYNRTVQPGTTKSVYADVPLDEVFYDYRQDHAALLEVMLIDEQAQIDADPANIVSREEEMKELHTLIYQALSELRKRSPYRSDVIILSSLVGLTDKETAELLERDYAAVRSAKAAARRELRKIILDILQRKGEHVEWFQQLRSLT